ncbi:unnamed protein product [Sphacelaria rigidula]
MFSVRCILLLVFAVWSAQTSLSDSPADDGEDTAATAAIAVSTQTSCGEVFESFYSNSKPLTFHVPDQLTCDTSKIVRFSGTAPVMLIVDDGVFDQLHFIVDPGAKLEIMGRSLLLQRTKGSNMPLFDVHGTVSLAATAGMDMQEEDGSSKYQMDEGDVIRKGPHGVVLFHGDTATSLTRDSLLLYRATPPPISNDRVTADASTLPSQTGDKRGVGVFPDSWSREDVQLPPFLRGVPVKARLESLKVGESLKFSQHLVSPSGAAAISLTADGSVSTRRTAASPMPDTVDNFELLKSEYRQAYSFIKSREDRRLDRQIIEMILKIQDERRKASAQNKDGEDDGVGQEDDVEMDMDTDDDDDEKEDYDDDHRWQTWRESTVFAGGGTETEVARECGRPGCGRWRRGRDVHYRQGCSRSDDRR